MTKIKLVFGKTNTARVVPVDCTINVPMEDGSMQEQSLTASCELLADEEVLAFYKDGGGGDVALLNRIVKAFPDLAHEGETAPDLETAKKGLFNQPYIRLGILRSYHEKRAGIAEKN